MESSNLLHSETPVSVPSFFSTISSATSSLLSTSSPPQSQSISPTSATSIPPSIANTTRSWFRPSMPGSVAESSLFAPEIHILADSGRVFRDAGIPHPEQRPICARFSPIPSSLPASLNGRIEGTRPLFKAHIEQLQPFKSNQNEIITPPASPKLLAGICLLQGLPNFLKPAQEPTVTPPLLLSRNLISLIHSTQDTQVHTATEEKELTTSSDRLKRRFQDESTQIAQPNPQASKRSRVESSSMDVETICGPSNSCHPKFFSNKQTLVDQVESALSLLFSRDPLHAPLAIPENSFALDSDSQHLLEEVELVEAALPTDQKEIMTKTLLDLRSVPLDVKTSEIVTDKLQLQILQFLDELKCLTDSIRSRQQSTSRPEFKYPSRLFRLVITTLFVLVCKHDRTMHILDQSQHRNRRDWVMSAFFEVVLWPVTHGSSDVVLLSKLGLAQMDFSQKRIPREVVELVLKPALMQFCNLPKLSLELIIGLHSVVEMFPTLFKEVFGGKIVDTLEQFLDSEQIKRKFESENQVVDKERIYEMLTHMLDLFRLFATTKAFSCERWVKKLCNLSVRLNQVWGPEMQITSNPETVCRGLKAPLCRLVNIYPAVAVDALINLESEDEHILFKDLLAELKACHHSLPLNQELQSRIAGIIPNPTLEHPIFPRSFPSDVTLLVGPSQEEFSAHRIVLASRCHFFQHQLATIERGQPILMPEFYSSSIRVVLDHIYGAVLDVSNLSLDSWRDLLRLTHLLELERFLQVLEQRLCELVDSGNVFELAHIAHDWPSSRPSALRLTVGACGQRGGEMLLRSCQAHLMSSLGSLASKVDLSDFRITQLL